MTVRSGKRAAKQTAEVRREAIVDAAIRVFARTSYRAAGTAEIAREAGIAEPTIYRPFDSKRALYLAALGQCGAIIRDQFARIAEATPLAHEALEAMGEWYRKAMETDPLYLRLRQRSLAETDDPEIQRVVHDMYDNILGLVAGVFRRGQGQGSINATISPEAGAWLFVAIGHMMDLSRLIGLAEGEFDDGCHGMIDVVKRVISTEPA